MNCPGRRRAPVAPCRRAGASSSSGLDPGDPGVRAVPLVRAGRVDVAADRRRSTGACGREVHAVDDDLGAGVVGGGRDRR